MDWYKLNALGAAAPLPGYLPAAQDHKLRFVAEDRLGEYWVSTVFLMFDHNFDNGRARLFETMAFKNQEEIRRLRYTTFWEARLGHRTMLRWLICALRRQGERPAHGEVHAPRPLRRAPELEWDRALRHLHEARAALLAQAMLHWGVGETVWGVVPSWVDDSAEHRSPEAALAEFAAAPPGCRLVAAVVRQDGTPLVRAPLLRAGPGGSCEYFAPDEDLWVLPHPPVQT